jgi:2'-5' RNA ligase
MGPMTMARLFVATWPPEEVLDALRSIPRPDQPDLRFTTEDQWHVTLRFLGNVDEEAVPRVVDALAVLGACGAVEAEVLPAPKRLGRTAVVLDVDGLAPVAAAVAGAVGHLGGDDRPFHGHVTLARMRRPGRWPSGGIGGLAEPIRWRAGEVALVRSRLGRGPAAYETLTTVPLLGDGTT